MLDCQNSTLPDPPPPSLAGPEAMPDSVSSTRAVVPRRPLRLSPPREDDMPDPRQALAALNIFSDVFDAEPVTDPDARLDPRIRASRRRAQRLLAPSADIFPPDEANFWHSSVPSGAVTQHSGHGTATVSANDVPNLPVPLHVQLARVRAALYTDETGTAIAPADPPSAQMRLASHAMNATLIVVAFPVGAAVTTYSLVRGGDIRLSAQAMAIVAAVMGAWQSGLERLL